jgi:hypothetical protein
MYRRSKLQQPQPVSQPQELPQPLLPVPKISRRMMIHHQLLPKAQNPD